MRPILTATLRPRWRDAETLQFGTDPAVAVVLTGLRASDRAVLKLLDGTRSEAAVVAAAACVGATPGQVTRLLDTLRRAGVVEDAAAAGPLLGLPPGDRERLGCELAQLSLACHAPETAAEALHHRLRAQVLVLGGGRLGAPIAALLQASGVGGVEVWDPMPAELTDAVPGGLRPGDAGRPRQEAVADLVGEARVRRRSGSPLEAALVILAPPPGRDVTTAERLRRDGVPHLAVDTVDGAGIVGPLVLPARSACLRCLDAHRRDRDPAWVAPDDRGWPETSGSALAVATAALATMQALAFLDEPHTGVHPATVDGTLELRPPDWRLRRRTWPPHPDCGCAA